MENNQTRYGRAKARIKDAVKAEKIKAHVVRNKEVYIVAVIGGVATTVAYFANQGDDTSVSVDVGRDNFGTISNTNIGTQINNAPNRLSYIVTDGKRWWETQAKAAKELGIRESDLSKHLNHDVPLPNGVELERMGTRSA